MHILPYSLHFIHVKCNAHNQNQKFTINKQHLSFSQYTIFWIECSQHYIPLLGAWWNCNRSPSKHPCWKYVAKWIPTTNFHKSWQWIPDFSPCWSLGSKLMNQTSNQTICTCKIPNTRSLCTKHSCSKGIQHRYVTTQKNSARSAQNTMEKLLFHQSTETPPVFR